MGIEMTCEFTCDHCGKKAPGVCNDRGDWFKPHKWYQRTDIDTKQTYVACSRSCAEELGGIIAPW